MYIKIGSRWYCPKCDITIKSKRYDCVCTARPNNNKKQIKSKWIKVDLCVTKKK